MFCEKCGAGLLVDTPFTKYRKSIDSIKYKCSVCGYQWSVSALSNGKVFIYHAVIDDAYGPNIDLGTYSSEQKARLAYKRYTDKNGTKHEGQLCIWTTEVK